MSILLSLCSECTLECGCNYVVSAGINQIGKRSLCFGNQCRFSLFFSYYYLFCTLQSILIKEELICVSVCCREKPRTLELDTLEEGGGGFPCAPRIIILPLLFDLKKANNDNPPEK